jgi:hypothetical protein
MRKVIKKLEAKRGYRFIDSLGGIMIKFCGDISTANIEDVQGGEVYYESTTGKMYVAYKDSTGIEWIELG